MASGSVEHSELWKQKQDRESSLQYLAMHIPLQWQPSEIEESRVKGLVFHAGTEYDNLMHLTEVVLILNFQKTREGGAEGALHGARI